MKNALKTGIAAIALAASLATTAFAADFDVNVTSTDLALRGVDPVSYFTQGEPQQGDVNISAVHNGAVYRFTSEETKAQFEAEPEKYAPQYGGYCAFGLANGFKFDGDPDVWRIVDDRLYLNLSPAVSEIWQKDIPGYIETAENLWTDVKDADPADLNP
ncbi:YHS domain-containing (seleno)protein [Loktanella sp. Alg231-35]|uniref:YHS domain-containing (seleno)protein n=1 Tax=Loktanella sp. Alg231-35 TaxID=1922220 RepID=UPI000D54EDB7|nr:YHS domain-containing (seleno)protein [Loktanella sp. Alg231-35]